MKKFVLCISLSVLSITSAFSENNCFIAKENNTIIQMEGDCETRFTPQSTFKIALSLMGYDSGIFKTETSPEWPFKEEYEYYVNVCKHPHDPRTWMRDSCVWYSRVFTQMLGMNQFKQYVEKFNYGNRDVRGDKGQNNGLTNSWITSSLEISPKEQVVFLEKINKNQLPVKAKSLALTKKIMFREELPGGWELYGKTGNGLQLNADKSKKLDLQHGWFVGWIEKNGRIITFASHLVDDKKQKVFASFRAKEEAKNKLWFLIEERE